MRTGGEAFVDVASGACAGIAKPSMNPSKGSSDASPAAG
jgi:hypothetical protein